MLAASMPSAGRSVAPGGTVGRSAYSYLPSTAEPLRVFSDVVVVIGKNAALPSANWARAWALFQPIAAWSTTPSFVTQSK